MALSVVVFWPPLLRFMPFCIVMDTMLSELQSSGIRIKIMTPIPAIEKLNLRHD
jgi:hypothetical protein